MKGDEPQRHEEHDEGELVADVFVVSVVPSCLSLLDTKQELRGSAFPSGVWERG